MNLQFPGYVPSQPAISRVFHLIAYIWAVDTRAAIKRFSCGPLQGMFSLSYKEKEKQGRKWNLKLKATENFYEYVLVSSNYHL